MWVRDHDTLLYATPAMIMSWGTPPRPITVCHALPVEFQEKRITRKKAGLK